MGHAGNASVGLLRGEEHAGVLLEAFVPRRRKADVAHAPSGIRHAPVRSPGRNGAFLENGVRRHELTGKQRIEDGIRRLDFNRPRNALHAVCRRDERGGGVGTGRTWQGLAHEIVVGASVLLGLRRERPFAVERRRQIARDLHEEPVGRRAPHHLDRPLSLEVVFGASPHIPERHVLRAIAERKDATRLLVQTHAVEHLEGDLRTIARARHGTLRLADVVVAVPSVERTHELGRAVTDLESARHGRIALPHGRHRRDLADGLRHSPLRVIASGLRVDARLAGNPHVGKAHIDFWKHLNGHDIHATRNGGHRLGRRERRQYRCHAYCRRRDGGFPCLLSHIQMPCFHNLVCLLTLSVFVKSIIPNPLSPPNHESHK